MAPSPTDIVKLCEALAEQEDLKVTVSQSLLAACIAATGAFLGGVLGGPIGIAIGGTGGSLVASYKTSGKFKSVVSVIREDMTDAQKARLASSVSKILHSIDAADVITLLTVLSANEPIKAAVIRELGGFLGKELNLFLTN